MTAPTTPLSILAPDFPAIERHLAELLDLPQWVVWKLVQKPNKPKPDKIPHVPQLSQRKYASVSDRDTWGYFGAVKAVYEASRGYYEGIGFILTEGDPYTFIDLDSCHDPLTGTTQLWAREIVTRFDTYTELSPSGTGLHLLARAVLPGPGMNKRTEGRAVEMYDRSRMATITGHVLEVQP